MNDNYSCTVEVVYVYVYVYVASERTNYMSIVTLLFWLKEEDGLNFLVTGRARNAGCLLNVHV